MKESNYTNYMHFHVSQFHLARTVVKYVMTGDINHALDEIQFLNFINHNRVDLLNQRGSGGSTPLYVPCIQIGLLQLKHISATTVD